MKGDRERCLDAAWTNTSPSRSIRSTSARSSNRWPAERPPRARRVEHALCGRAPRVGGDASCSPKQPLFVDDAPRHLEHPQGARDARRRRAAACRARPERRRRNFDAEGVSAPRARSRNGPPGQLDAHDAVWQSLHPRNGSAHQHPAHRLHVRRPPWLAPRMVRMGSISGSPRPRCPRAARADRPTAADRRPAGLCPPVWESRRHRQLHGARDRRRARIRSDQAGDRDAFVRPAVIYYNEARHRRHRR